MKSNRHVEAYRQSQLQADEQTLDESDPFCARSITGCRVSNSHNGTAKIRGFLISPFQGIGNVKGTGKDKSPRRKKGGRQKGKKRN